MDIFDGLSALGGLCLFLFGMSIMAEALQRRAGGRLGGQLRRMTRSRWAGFFTGLAVTAAVQSSSAAMVMVVGFVNSGLLTLGQAVGIIMGTNVGTTVTPWLLSLGGLEGGGFPGRLLRPAGFVPLLSLWGIIAYLSRNGRRRDTGQALLGFATLMQGMDLMSGSVAGLAQAEGFRRLFTAFTDPLLGLLAGAVLTAVIQSSSASVGILQALAVTGQVSYAAAIPIIMGQNIGTCVTALLSSVGTTKNARRAAVVHLMFNIIGTAVCLTLFVLADALSSPAILGESASYLGIAVCHTVFNVICTTLMLPAAGLLEKLVCRIVPDGKQPEAVCELDERLLATPSIALERCRVVTNEMADVAAVTLRDAAAALQNYTPELAQAVREGESKTDHYEDILGTYLVKLSALKISENDSSEAAMLLKALSDFERIGDHALNLVESAEELKNKNLALSDAARHELTVLLRAVDEIVDMTFQAFRDDDLEKAYRVEPLEQVIDDLKEKMRIHHILRMQQGSCSIESGFVWSDLLTALERVGDHCSNIAGCIIDLHHHNMNTHEAIRSARMENENFDDEYRAYAVKYSLK